MSESNNIFYAGVYLRLSKDDEIKSGENSDSIENQKSLIEGFISKCQNIIIYDYFIDDGFTGLNFDRPAFKKLIGEINNKNINCIVVKDISRLGREHIKTSEYIEEIFPSKGVRFISIIDNYDSFSKNSNLEILSFKNIFNEMYSKDISGKIRSVLLNKMYKGECVKSTANYGYIKNPKNKHQLIIDEYPASIVKIIFTMYLAGNSQRKIVKFLNSKGILSPKDYRIYRDKLKSGDDSPPINKSVWIPSTVNRILRNEVYIGNMVQHKTENKSHKNKERVKINKENNIIVENTHQPIIDRTTFYSVQKSLDNKSREMKVSKGNINKYTGIIKCSDCGKALTRGGTNASNIRYFNCSTYKNSGGEHCYSRNIREDVIDKIVLIAIQQEARKALDYKDIKDLKSYRDKLKEDNNNLKFKGYDDILKELTLKITKIDNYIADLFKNLSDGTLDKELFTNLKNNYTKERKDIEKEITEITKLKKEENNLNQKHQDWLINFIDYVNIKEINRIIVYNLIDVITVSKDKTINIKFKFKSPYI